MDLRKRALPGKPKKKKFRWRKCSFNSRGGVRYGCYGKAVKKLQQYLNLIMEYYAANYKPLKDDGYFGRKTLQALRDATQLTRFPDVSGNYVDKARMKAIVAFWNKMSQPKKQKSRTSSARPSQSQSLPIKAADIENVKLRESKFSNDKELQNLMESFKKFTRND